MTDRTISLLTFSGFSSILKFFLGLQLLNPFVDTFASAPGFALLASIMSESLLGMIFIVAGIHQFAVFMLIRPGDNSSHLLAIRFASVMLFGLFAACIFISNPSGTGIVTYGSIALFELARLIYIGGRRENRMLN